MAEKRTKILVVDDDLRLRDLLHRYLTEQVFAVQTAPDASAMDRLLNREIFDLLVLDLMMPGEDGLAVCRRLRAAANPVPIIMLTPLDKAHVRREFIRGRLFGGDNGVLHVEANPATGSHRLRAAADSNALIVVPEGPQRYAAGSVVEVLPL